MTNITKIQRGVLEAAARRNDYAAWPIRDSKLNTGSATRVMKELIRKGLVDEKPARDKAPTWREDDSGRLLTAIISDDGLAAIGMAPIGKKARPSGSSRDRGPVAADKAAVAVVSDNAPRMPRAGTKLAVLIGLLERKEGATIGELSEAVGWRAHSVRGVLSGVLMKKFGLKLGSEKVEKRGRTYRIGLAPK